MAGIEFKSLGVGTPAKVLLLPQGAMADTPEVGVPRGFAKDDSDEGEGDDEGPAVVKTVSARSRTGAVVVCPPGLVEDEALPSHGSILHAAGNCQPCAWFWRPGSCHNGRECGHCHLCPEGELKARKRRRQAMLRLGLAGATPKPGAEAEPRKVSFAAAGPCEAGAEPRKVSFTSHLVTHTRSEGAAGSARMSRRARLAAFLEDGEGQEGQEAAPVAWPTEPRAAPPEAPEAPPGPRFSRGAALHGAGRCKPCAWYWRPGSCQNGEECGHCHMCEEGELKARKKSKQAMLRLGLATPKPAPVTELDLLAKAFSFAAASFGDPRAPWAGRRASEPESTTASNSELEDDSAGSAEAPGLEAPGPLAKTRAGSFMGLPPGLRAPPGTPSHGSALHRLGQCWPCANFWKQGGCTLGEECGYCHLCPQNEIKMRPASKQAMMRLGLATPKVEEDRSLSFFLDEEASGTAQRLPLCV